MFSRGFTGHEHLDLFALINMNGRVYDPLLGRFLSPDNYVQSPDFTQSYNRYAYCVNNPLKYNDPSGYTWFSRLGDWLGKAGRTIATIVVSVAVVAAVATIPGLGAIGVAFVGGMLSGFASGGLGAALNGGDVFSGAVMGACIGAATGLVTLGLGTAISNGLNNIAISMPYAVEGGIATLESRSIGGFISSFMPKIDALIDGISNFALGSGIFGGGMGGAMATSIASSESAKAVFANYQQVLNGGDGLNRSFDNVEFLDMNSKSVVYNNTDLGVKLVHFKQPPDGVLNCSSQYVFNEPNDLTIYRQVRFEKSGHKMFTNNNLNSDPMRLYFRTLLLDRTGKLSTEYSYFSISCYVDGCSSGIKW